MSDVRRCYVAVIHQGKFRIGIAEWDVPGFRLTNYPESETMQEAEQYADWLNSEERGGPGKLRALKIVLSSMNAQNREKPAVSA